ncbi:drug/metabolite transporter (DMT)-like permease [Cryobacterium mesophilum]|uniref:EamA family transporter n=1 Tax=Terrimesophilobacter mesophilus TaxID=433647 RepID=A0A4R8V979_9MICO|nr:EamA family transporter [Terrimesophilobacter mesophilus]MBB5632477.1 drug/metabolite transporter (DMT)-like permease [Terrimesophilobacter mesophilus]TFB79303.1 EamA family transporter [Terrimesophilobacter mesophilus]
MSLLVLALVGFAAIAHAAWNIAIKRAGTSGPGFLWLSFIVGAVVFLPFGIFSLVDAGVDLLHWLWLAVVSGALQIAYFFLLQRGYRQGDVSVVYPLARGTGPLLTVVFAMILFGERPGLVALAGAALVIAGVVITGLAGGRADAANNRAGILYGLVIGVLIAVYTLWDSAAVTVGGMPAVGLYWGSVLFQFLLLAPVGLRSRRGLAATAKRHWVAILIVGVLAPLAYIIVLLAFQLAPVSLVAPAREVSVVLVGLAGWLFFHEPHPARRLVGAGVVLTGIALLAAS